MLSKLPIIKLTVWSVLAGVLSSLASATVAVAAPVGTLSWYGSYADDGTYADNQIVTGKKRFILTDLAISGFNKGYLKWCVSLNGQPLSMSENADQGSSGIATNYLYFAYGQVTRTQNAQSELGCWNVTSKDLVDSSKGIDLTINTASWPDGLHTLTFTGHHVSGVVGAKFININTVNSTSQVKISSSSGTSLGGLTNLSVDYSRMNRANKICLLRNRLPVDSSFKFLGAAPDASGCWPIVDTNSIVIGDKNPKSWGERLSGTRTAEFTVNTLNWVDGAQTIEAVVPHVYPEIGSGSASFTSLNPALGLNVLNLIDGEQVNGIRTVSIVSVINAVHTSQVQTASYCIDFDGQQCSYSLKSTANSAGFEIDTKKYVDGPHLLKFRVIDSAGREASKTVTIQISNPALGLNVSGLIDGEQVNGIRTVAIASVINAVHTSQIQTASYCIDFDGQQCLYSLKSSSNSAAFDIDPRKYVDGPHSLKFRVIDSAGREASKSMTVQISNGKPIVTGAKVSTTKPRSANGTASATIEFNAPRSSAATVRVAAGKGNASQIDIDLLSSSGNAASATFESLKPATKFTYQITARNANGESKTVTGKFTTPAAPKKVSRGGGGGSGQSSGSGYGISVINWRLDKALAALGWSRSQAAEYSRCPNPTWLGIINLDNWIVVGQTSSMLYACKP